VVSIIISSYKQELFNNVSKNIKETIGVPFEIIQIWNPNKMGICAAYNEGVAKANYEYLVFAHEDILFHNQNWGNELIKTFESDPEIGLVGVIGSHYKASILSGWVNHKNNHSSNLISNFNGHVFYDQIKNGIKVNKSQLYHYEDILKLLPNKTEYEEVVCLDGLFMATKKSVYNEFQFDELTFKNFHCYDIDYSLQVTQKYKVVVSYNIFVCHYSFGSFNQQWIKDSLLLRKKWIKLLPHSNRHLSNKAIIEFEKTAYILLTHIIRKNKKYFHLLFTEIFNFSLFKKVGLMGSIYLMFTILKHSLYFVFKK
jgi:glycosyltransferase involved in cell wall biosynthesis